VRKKKAAEAASPHIEDQGDSGSGAFRHQPATGQSCFVQNFLLLPLSFRVSSSTDKERSKTLSVTACFRPTFPTRSTAGRDYPDGCENEVPDRPSVGD
jgi:hypothetical protein